MKQLLFLPIILFMACCVEVPETVEGVVCAENFTTYSCDSGKSATDSVYMYTIHVDCNDQRPTYVFSTEDLLDVNQVVSIDPEFCGYDRIEFYENNELIKHDALYLKILNWKSINSPQRKTPQWGGKEAKF